MKQSIRIYRAKTIFLAIAFAALAAGAPSQSNPETSDASHRSAPAFANAVYSLRIVNESGQAVSVYIEDDYVGQISPYGDGQPLLVPKHCKIYVTKGGEVVWGPKVLEADETVVIR